MYFLFLPSYYRKYSMLCLFENCLGLEEAHVAILPFHCFGKIPQKVNQGGCDLHWLQVSEFSDHRQQVPLLSLS
jgi:hypothetical protein